MNSTIFSSKEAQKVLFELYQIKGSVTVLPGEVDFNFKIQTENGERFILKISKPNSDYLYLDYQNKILEYINSNALNQKTPKVFNDQNGNAISTYIDNERKERKVRLLSWISGRVWSSVNPQTDNLRYDLGINCGLITSSLEGFDNKVAHRNFEWDVAQCLWIKGYLSFFNDKQKQLFFPFIHQFESFQSEYVLLRKSIVHNDVNDNNCIVSLNITKPKVIAIIDYGDTIYTQIINDVAIACSYAIMHHNDPLEAALPIVKGYHESFSLEEKELPFLYTCIAMRLIISVTKSEINKKEESENKYLLISEKPAWELLEKWSQVNSEYAHYAFRNACGFNPNPNQTAFENWALNQEIKLSDFFPNKNLLHAHLLDLSISSTWLGPSSDFNNLDLFQFKLDQLQKEYPDFILSGGYMENRPLYTSSAYDKIGNSGDENRCVHLGIDFWLPPQTPVHAFLDGHVVIVVNNEGEKAYGGMLVIKHEEADLMFYSLYGHLSYESIKSYKKGDVIKKGSEIGKLGTPLENGNWASHLHFQLMLSLMDYTDDFPGVSYSKQKKCYSSICPDPNLLFKDSALSKSVIDQQLQILSDRKLHLGKGMSLQYKDPLHIVRGEGVYLIDINGKKYLDTVNNVAHVGHEHPRVVKKGKDQMAVLNTNSRYLHKNITCLAKSLLATLPSELNVLHFVNSGSEANELAIRMVKTVTGSDQIIASQHGYHGNTNVCVDISSYKFDGKGGKGASKNAHIFPIPDSFRGKYRGNETASLYANEIANLIGNIHLKDEKVGGFIIEPIISCGGQIELPKEFLKKAYQLTREAGGLCISDEIQTGCGRMGETFWGFQLHDVLPDIVTIGKPLGNGHPIAAIACTRDVAEKFANGMEFFSTFGGNPVSSVIANEVLAVVKDEKLQENALEVGRFLKEGLLNLAQKFPIIKSVRGKGLFLGIELVDKDLIPLSIQAEYLVNRMKYFGILMSTDGPDHNVIKIKPPIIFSQKNAEKVLFYLSKVMKEDLMRFLNK